MAERVVSAHRDYRDARVDGSDESSRRSVARSVMAHLHDVSMKIVFAEAVGGE
jgi:hypothetical protein